MHKYTFIVFLMLLISSCAVTKPPVEHTIIQYRDSLIYKHDTVGVPIPVETVKEVTPDDTLRMETSVAKAEAYYDKDVKMLRGKLENKKGEIKTEIVYKERVVTRDSLIRVEVPVEVPVEVIRIPLFYKIFSVIGLFALFATAIWAAFTFKPRL